jgi:hypothetical protein
MATKHKQSSNADYLHKVVIGDTVMFTGTIGACNTYLKGKNPEQGLRIVETAKKVAKIYEQNLLNQAQKFFTCE